MHLLTLRQHGTVVSVHEVRDGALSERGRVDIPELAGPDERFFTWSSRGGVLTLVLPPGSRTPFLRSHDGGRTFTRPPEYPGARIPEPNRYRVQHDGSLTVIEGASAMAEIWEQSIYGGYGGGMDTGAGGGCVWRLGVGDDHWTAQRFAGPRVVEDVSLDPEGRVHMVGAVPGGDVRELRAAYAVLEHGHMELVDVGLGRRDARRLRQGGGAERFRGIWADQEPVVILSSCAWFLDDPSDYVILCEGGRGTLLRLERAFFGGAWRAPRGAVTVYAGNSWRLLWEHSDA